MFMKRRLEEMAPAVASGYGCNATVDWRLDEQPYYPPTVNDERMAEFAMQVRSGDSGIRCRVGWGMEIPLFVFSEVSLLSQAIRHGAPHVQRGAETLLGRFLESFNKRYSVLGMQLIWAGGRLTCYGMETGPGFPHLRSLRVPHIAGNTPASRHHHVRQRPINGRRPSFHGVAPEPSWAQLCSMPLSRLSLPTMIAAHKW